MLAIAFSLLFALYIIGPDQFSRFILGFTIPRRHVSLTRSEEVSRALVWAVASFLPALFWDWAGGTLSKLLSWSSIETAFSGLYSEDYFRHDPHAWFRSIHALLWLIYSLLWRVYLCTLALSAALSLATHHYGAIRRQLSRSRFLRGVLASLVLPRIAPWHVLLSGMLLDDPDWHIHADVLTKADGLYQGRVVDKVLGNDSELVTITLGDPRRFRRKEYLDAKAAKEHPDPSEFWVSIPTNIFLIMGGEIQTMNIRYVPSTVASLKSPSSDLARGLKELSKLVSALEASASSSIRKD